jgi:hypothetical protein
MKKKNEKQTMPWHSWNNAKVGIKRQSINQSINQSIKKYLTWA